MLAPDHNSVDIFALMQQVRTEVARRKSTLYSAEALESSNGSSFSQSGEAEYKPPQITMPRFGESGPELVIKNHYILDDFLRYHDEEFIVNAYRGVLGREPDSAGFDHNLLRLRRNYTKIEILGRLRYSPEGRRRGVKISGLMLPFMIHTAGRLPVVGYALRWVLTLLRLPSIVRSLEGFDAFLLAQTAERFRSADASAAEAECAINSGLAGKADRNWTETALSGKADRNWTEAALSGKANRSWTEEALSGKADRDWAEVALSRKAEHELLLQLEKRLSEAVSRKAENTQVEQLSARVQTLTDSKADRESIAVELGYIRRQLIDHSRSIASLQGRLKLVLGELRANTPDAERQAPVPAAEVDWLLEAFYVSFEDHFRGTREEIKQRVAYYLPIVKAVQAGSSATPILDIGCGRGEWLELLAEQDLKARGVDLNRIMASECRELGLDVTDADAIDYLRGLKPGSLGAVTGMHIVEHLPFNILVDLFDETLRVLRPGGVAIFETPNPENVKVGSCYFYLDPTHRNPLPPPVLQYMAEARGFVKSEIHRLQEHRLRNPLALVPADIPGASEVNAAIQIIKDNFFAAPDYALVVYK